MAVVVVMGGVSKGLPMWQSQSCRTWSHSETGSRQVRGVPGGG